MGEVTVAAKIPFETDARLRELKRRTGINVERLVYAAIIRFLDEVDDGKVPEVKALERQAGKSPNRRSESGIPSG